MIVGINCGHTVSGTVGSGAVGFLNESNETRRVGYKVMEYLRAKGVTVVDCTDDYSSTVSGNLKKIVDKSILINNIVKHTQKKINVLFRKLQMKQI